MGLATMFRNCRMKTYVVEANEMSSLILRTRTFVLILRTRIVRLHDRHFEYACSTAGERVRSLQKLGGSGE